MPLRIGFDMDGVLADFSGAFHEIETQLFGRDSALSAGQPEKQEASRSARDGQAAAGSSQAVEPNRGSGEPGEQRRRRDLIWQAIQSTPDFWMTLRPTEPGAVRRIHDLMLRHRWEVFFITQRPATEGDTVQRQTQRWLVEQGFDLPSVLVIGGSRGAAAAALRLDYHVDDSPQNCLDVLSGSNARPLLVGGADDAEEATAGSARKLGIGLVKSIGECLDVLEQATLARTQPTLFARLATLVGWK